MKKATQLKSLLVSMAIASSAALSFAPATTQAGELSYNMNVSNMYLWRGQTISNPSPAVFGGIDYAADSGLYVGTWTSSEGAAKSSEWDIYGGYAPTFGEFGLNFGYAAYLYPAATKDMFKSYKDASGTGSMIAEFIVGASYKDFSLTTYIDTEGSKSGNNMYFSGAYSMDKIGFHVGVTKNDTKASEYTDFSVSYKATDALSFTLSKAQGEALKNTAKENPMLQVTYALPI